jgi:hypothetical protein
MCRFNTFIDPNHSTLEEFFYLEVDLIDICTRFSSFHFHELWKHEFVGGMCEVGMKSLKSREMKRQEVCG